MAISKSGEVRPDKIAFQPTLQGIRALAVSLVVLYHLKFPLFSGGFVGVDIFFVLSGYLISKRLVSDTALQKNKKKSKKFLIFEFYRSRFWRLAPAAIMAICVTLFVSYFVQNSYQFKRNLIDASMSLFSIQNWHLYANSERYFASEASNSLFMHFWSLSIEDQFYFLLPVILFLLFKIQAARFPKNVEDIDLLIKQKVLKNLFCIFFISYLYSLYTYYRGSESAYFSLFTRFWELGAGVLLAFIKPNSKKIDYSLHAWCGLILIFVSLSLITSTNTFPGWQGIIVVSGSALLIYSLPKLHEASTFSKIFSTAVAQWIGNRSYSIYLVHWPLLLLCEEFQLNGWSLYLVYFPALLFLSTLSYRKIENRYRNSRRMPTLINFFLSGLKSIGSKYLLLLFSLIFSSFLILYSSNLQQPAGSAENLQNSFQTSNAAEENLKKIPDSPKNDVLKNKDDQTEYIQNWRKKVINSLTVKSIKGMNPALNDLISKRDEFWKKCMDSPRLGNPSCILGRGSSGTTVAVVGDSIARSYAEMVAASNTFADARLDLYIFAGCPITTFTNFRTQDTENLKCKSNYEREFKYLTKKSYSLLIIASADDNTATELRKKYSIQELLIQSISYIKPIAPKLIFLGMPSKQKPLVECVNSANEITKACLSKSVDYAEIQFMELGATKKLGGRFMNPNEMLCSRGSCPPVIDGSPVFYDGAHLTEEILRKMSTLFDIWYKAS